MRVRGVNKSKHTCSLFIVRILFFFEKNGFVLIFLDLKRFVEHQTWQLDDRTARTPDCLQEQSGRSAIRLV